MITRINLLSFLFFQTVCLADNNFFGPLSVPNQILQTGIATTTNATTTILATLTMYGNNLYTCQALVAGRRTDSAGRYSVSIVGSAYRESSGSCTKNGTDVTVFSSGGSYTVSFTCGGNNLLLRVQGAASETINWTGTMKCQSAS